MAARTMSAGEAAELELAAIGLKVGATQNQIAAALRSHYPNGVASSLIDPKTGLPYTKTTANAAGDGNIVGQVLGGTALAATIGIVAEGLSGIGAAATETETTAGAAGSSATAATGAAEAGTAAKLASTASNLSKLAEAGGIAALLVDPSFLFRALKFIGGLVLAYFGVKTLAAAAGGASAHRATVTA